MTVLKFVEEIWASGPSIEYPHPRRWHWWHRYFCNPCDRAVAKFERELREFYEALIFLPMMSIEAGRAWAQTEIGYPE